jgi:uncharacterized protein
MISMMKRAVALAAVLLTLGAGAQASAQETEIAPEHLDLARKYVELTDKSGVYEVALVETAVETMRTILSQNPEILDPVNTAIEKTLTAYKGNKGQLMDQFARVYALTFTMDELKEIVAFYESPVGNKLVTANASINPTLQDVMNVFQINLKQEFYAKVRAELKAAGYDV